MGSQVSLIQIIYQAERIEKILHKADAEVREAFQGMVKKVQGMTLLQLNKSKGLGWEKIPGKYHEGQEVWSLRINRDWRAMCILHTGPKIEILLISNHDAAYRRR